MLSCACPYLYPCARPCFLDEVSRSLPNFFFLLSIQEKARIRMMKQRGSDTSKAWTDLWGSPKDFQNEGMHC